jgi:hypothetical protein
MNALSTRQVIPCEGITIPTDGVREIGSGEYKDVLPWFELIQLRQDGIDDLSISIQVLLLDPQEVLTLRASPGSDPPDVLLPVRLSTSSTKSACAPSSNGVIPIMIITNVSSLSAILVTWEKSFWTSFPDSENHLENNECELISTSFVLR